MITLVTKGNIVKVPVYLVDETDGYTPETGVLTPTIYISKNGAAEVVPHDGTWAEIDATNMPGSYTVQLDGTDTDTQGYILIDVYKSGVSRRFVGVVFVQSAGAGSEIPVSATLRDKVRIILQEVGATDIFSNDELDVAIIIALIEFSKKRPYKVVETLDTVANSRLVDISGVSGLLFGYSYESFHPIYGVEYPVAQYPEKYRNFDVIGTNIKMRIDSPPSASAEDVYVTCFKAHTADTIPSAYEYLVVRLAAALAAKNKPLNYLNEWQAETTKFDTLTTAVGNMSARITQAITDLASGRTLIGDQRNNARDAIDDVSDRITQAVADLTSGRALIGDNRASAVTAIGDMSARITQAVGDLTSGRTMVGDNRDEAIAAIDNMIARMAQAITELSTGSALIGSKRDETITAIENAMARITNITSLLDDGSMMVADERDEATTAIDEMATRITQAVADIALARTFFNKANIGQPEQEYLHSASQEGQAALVSLNKARGYLAEEGTTSSYRQQVSAELNLSNTHLNQARVYLATEGVPDSYRRQAIGELNVASTYLNQARGYMALEVTPQSYRSQAVGELNSANTLLNQARGYLAVESTADSYRNQAVAELNNARALLAQANNYLALEVTTQSYRSQAVGELNIANTSLNQGRGYVEHLKMRIASINLADKYEAWGIRMEASLQKELNACALRRGYKEWSTS